LKINDWQYSFGEEPVVPPSTVTNLPGLYYKCS